MIALDEHAMEILKGRADEARARASATGVQLADDPYLFACDLQGTDPWDPDTITQYFSRLRDRLGLSHLDFKSLRAFMDTYGQELGFSGAQVALRAGHDPAVAARFYTSRVDDTDRALSNAMAKLLRRTRNSAQDNQAERQADQQDGTATRKPRARRPGRRAEPPGPSL